MGVVGLLLLISLPGGDVMGLSIESGTAFAVGRWGTSYV